MNISRRKKNKGKGPEVKHSRCAQKWAKRPIQLKQSEQEEWEEMRPQSGVCCVDGGGGSCRDLQVTVKTLALTLRLRSQQIEKRLKQGVSCKDTGTNCGHLDHLDESGIRSANTVEI